MVHSTDLPLDDTPQKRSSKLGRGDSAQLRHPKVRPAEMGQQRWPVKPILVKWRCRFQWFQKPMEGYSFLEFLLSLFFKLNLLFVAFLAFPCFSMASPAFLCLSLLLIAFLWLLPLFFLFFLLSRVLLFIASL